MSTDASLILGNLVTKKRIKQIKKPINRTNSTTTARSFERTERRTIPAAATTTTTNNNFRNKSFEKKDVGFNRRNRLKVEIVKNDDGQVRRSELKYKFGPPKGRISKPTFEVKDEQTNRILSNDKTEKEIISKQEPERNPGGNFSAAMLKFDSLGRNKQLKFQAKFSDRPNKSRPVGFDKQFQKNNNFRSNKNESSFNTGNFDKTENEMKSRERHSNPKTSRLFDENIMDGIEDVQTLKVDVKHEELFSEKKFSDLNLSNLVVAALKQRFELETATQVQALTIPHLLEGKDALVKSATGSGKTLAYSIPMIENLQSIKPNIGRTMGIHSLIILPTRELAIQTYDCIEKLLNPFRRIVLGILVGGEKKKSEKARIRKGMNILVTTPGRLLDHISSTKTLLFDKLKWLVIDEADRLYEQGFSAMISQILEYIQEKCQNNIQTILLSATLSTGVKELAGLSLKNPAIVDVSDKDKKMEKIVLPTSLDNFFMVVPAKLRLVILSSILIRSIETSQKEFGSKIIVFMSCQDVVDYFCCLFNVTLNRLIDLKEDNQDNSLADEDEENKKVLTILQLRGNMKQEERTKTFRKFQSSKYGILFCTDVVSRGLDLPNVDLVVQMSCPSAIEDYVHRVGRTARVGCQGKSILFVLPSETRFIQNLQENISVNLTPIKVESYFDSLNKLFSNKKTLNTEQERLAYLQHQFEDDVYANDNLKKLATKSYLSHLRAYASYPRKMAYFMPFRELHIGHIAKSFALRESPSELGASVRQDRRRIKSKLGNTATMKRKAVAIEQMCSEFGGGVIGGTIKKKKHTQNE